jgi:hypothetical protein
MRLGLWVILLCGLYPMLGCDRPTSWIDLYDRPATPQPVSMELTVPKTDPPAASLPDELQRLFRRVVRSDGTFWATEFDEERDIAMQAAAVYAKTGPTASPNLFSSKEEQLAFWYNARQLWSMIAAMELYRNGYNDASKIGEFQFPLDGRTMTLPKIDEAIRELASVRYVVAAPSASMQRAGMSRTPLKAETIEAFQLANINAMARDHGRFKIDVQSETILYPPILWKHRKTSIQNYLRLYGGSTDTALLTTLLPHLDTRSNFRLQHAVGYAEKEDTTPPKLAVQE